MIKALQLLIISVCISAIGFAQNGINYKALIKDDSGNSLANSSITIKFQILESVAQNNVYEETHTPTTDTNGIIIVNIGEGTVVAGVFDDISWGDAEHFLNVKIDIGSGFIDMGTTQFSVVPYALHAKKAANVKGLEALDEGNGIGWRLVDRNSAYYGNIGENAVDFSFSNSALIPKGALGLNSFATGFFTEATGDYTTSMGYNTEAAGDYSTSLGFNTETIGNYAIASGQNSSASGEASTALGTDAFATGDYATALGRSVTASGDYATATGNQTEASGDLSIATGLGTTASGYTSTAMGRNTTASGNSATALGRSTSSSGFVSMAMGNLTSASSSSSTAMGNSTTASNFAATAMGYSTTATGYTSTAMGRETNAIGTYSTAMGYMTQAESYLSTAIGSYNIGGGAEQIWNGTDPLFEIGNSLNGTPRSNALTVLKNGNIGIGTHTPEEKLHITGGRLRIGSETIEDGGNNALRFNASLWPDSNNAMSLGSSSLRWTTVYATNGSINTSDRREKKNIKALSYGLAEVLQMQPVSFNWKNQKNPDTKLGLIAQDLQQLIPEVVKTHEWQSVSEDENQLLKRIELDRLGVYYSDLIPVLIKAIQEQQDIINRQKEANSLQKAELSALQNSYQSLLSRIETLESNASK